MRLLSRRAAGAWIVALGMLLAQGLPALAQGAEVGALKLEVTELANSVAPRTGEQFLTVTVEIVGTDPTRLRRVQPLREDFQLLVGKQILPCRWLRGGSIPDDARRLRFTMGFTQPGAGTRTVSLRANLPRLEGDDVLELRLTGLQPGAKGQDRAGADWQLAIRRFAEEQYDPPALPAAGSFTSKMGPADRRVFRKTAEPAAERAVTLAFRSSTMDLYDRTVDVSGTLLVEGGPSRPLISASMERHPSRTVKDPGPHAFVQGEFHFLPPTQGRAVGAMVRLHRRPEHPQGKPVVIRNLPIPRGN